MITDTGSIKVGTPLDEKVQKEFLHKPFIISLTLLIIGSAGIAAYIVLTVLSEFVNITEPSFLLLAAFAFVFALGLLFIITRTVVLKKSRGANKSEEYEFYADHVMISDYENGERIAQVKIYYNRIVKRRETGNYLFFFVNNGTACPVDKASLPQGELDLVRTLLGFKAVGGGTVLPAGEKEKDNQEDKSN